MWEVVPVMGFLIVAASVYLMVRADQCSSLVNTVLATRWIYLGAFIRLMLGAALIASAHTVRFPELISALGWLLALGGLLLVAVPQKLWVKMGKWLAALPLIQMRLYLLIGVMFGGTLLYGAFA